MAKMTRKEWNKLVQQTMIEQNMSMHDALKYLKGGRR